VNLLVYLLNALLLAMLMLWLRKQQWTNVLQPYFIPALLLKLLCGILLGLIYHHYYELGDTLTYYNNSLKLSAYARENPGAYVKLILFNEFESEQFRSTIPFSRLPGFSNSFFMLKCTSVLNLLTGSSYYLNACYYSLFSFWGMAKLAAVLGKVYPATRRSAILAFLFFPSVVFWSSGLLKDGVMLGSMCWVVAFILQLAHRQPVKFLELLLLPFMLYILIRIKLFFSAALLLFLLSYLVVKLLMRLIPVLQKTWLQISVYMGLTLVIGLAATQIVSIYRLEFIVEQLVRTYEGIRQLSEHVPHIQYPSLEPTVASLLHHAPLALLNALFRPFIGEASGILYVAAGLENLFLLVLLILAVTSAFKKGAGSEFHLFDLALFLFVVITAVVIGISTPNFGTLIRYRIVFLPFLVYLLIQNYYVQRLLTRLKL